jgi:hypothetical protein
MSSNAPHVKTVDSPVVPEVGLIRYNARHHNAVSSAFSVTPNLSNGPHTDKLCGTKTACVLSLWASALLEGGLSMKGSVSGCMSPSVGKLVAEESVLI